MIYICTTGKQNIQKSLPPVKGGELFVERVTGLPQITVEYNRDKMAIIRFKHHAVNTICKLPLGSTAGVVFEGEKRFDMVVHVETKEKM